MTVERIPDLTAALAAVRRPLERAPMPPAELGVRIKTSPAARRLAPTRLAVRRAVAKGRALWENSDEERRRALKAMSAVVGGTARAGEVTELARMHLVETEVNTAFFWQPWETVRVDAASAAHLRAAVSANCGVLLSGCHVGPYFHITSLGRTLKRTVYVVAGEWCFEEPRPGYWGRRVVRRRQGLRAQGGRIVRAAHSFPLLLALLEQREILLITFDVPGGHETRFLGKPVRLAAGTARLSLQTGAPIVPVRARRAGHRIWVDAEAPLDPREFAGVDELHDALAAVHERWILELPATLEDPRPEGAWADDRILLAPSGAARHGPRPARGTA